MKSKLAKALAAEIVPHVFTSSCQSAAGIRAAWVNEIAAIIDQRLVEIRAHYEPPVLERCPIVTHHPPGPCADCITAAMREYILLTEA